MATGLREFPTSDGWLGRWALRPGGNPGLDEGSELRLRARSGRTPLAWVPRPPDERVRGHVLVELRETAPAVASAILQFQADVAQRFALPSHGGGGETPAPGPPRARNRGCPRGGVRVPMARPARQSGNPKTAWSPMHRGRVRVQIIALPRLTGHRVTVQAAGALNHLGGLGEQRQRPRASVVDRREGRDGLERRDLGSGPRNRACR